MNWESWLRDECTIKRVMVSSSTSFAQVLGPDPMRFLITIPFINTTYTIYNFSETSPVTYLFGNNGTSAVLYCDRAQFGQLITLPFWIAAGTASLAFEVVALSYNPQRKAIYDERVRKYLSDAGAL